MESFRAVLDRLTKKFIADVVASVETMVAVDRPTTTPRRRVVQHSQPKARPEPVRTPEAKVVVSSFDIPVGRPQTPTRRQRPRRQPSAPRPAAPPPAETKEQVVKFEVVPHPERANRRMVLTRISPTTPTT